MVWKKWERVLSLFLAGVVASCFITSCASIEKGEAEKGEKKFPVYGKTLLEAMQSGSYKKFVKDFSPELARTISENAFDKLRSDLEKSNDSIEKWQYLTNLNRAGIYRVDLWKVTFIRRTSTGKQPIERLFKVTSTRLDGKDQIIGFKFDMLF